MATSANESGKPLPIDIEILKAARLIYRRNPELPRNDLLEKVKQDNSWDISNKDIKKLLTQYPLDTDTEPAPPSASPYSNPPQLPPNALAAQQRYKDDSTRMFKLYGRGEHDYGVSPNSDQQIKIDIMHERLLKAGCPGPFNQESQDFIGTAWPLQELFNCYWAAAQKTGGLVTKEDVGRQLEAEYGINPLPYFKEPTIAEAEKRRAVYKEGMMKIKRKMMKTPEGRGYIPVDGRGNPVWDEAVNGEFTMLVVKINKGNGLTEYRRI